MMRKIFKWAALIILLIIVCISAVVPFRQNLKYNAELPALAASNDSSLIARGKAFVQGPAHCVNCHSPANADSLIAAGLEVPLSGGVKFALPVGDIYSKNITPDKETGIGNLSDAEIARVLRYGVHADGTAVYDFMPFHDMTDEDLVSVISYLRSVKPVYNKVPEDQLNVIGNVVKAFMVKPVGPRGPIAKSIRKDTSAAYGRYLAVSVADCQGCHTKRDMSGAITGELFAGGGTFQEKKGTFISPNLTPHPSGRINGWSEEMFIGRFRKGKLLDGSPMPWNAFGRMSDDELRAIYNYLKTVKPVDNPSLVTFVAKDEKKEK
jgi:mono/diheme cytochrome c family protein